MTNVQIAAMLASLQQQMAAIAAATLPPPPVVQSEQARTWRPSMDVVLDGLPDGSKVWAEFENRDAAFDERARLAAQDASRVYRVLPECRDDGGAIVSVLVSRAREAVAA